ncbi:hypothetical protein ACFQQE_14840 [Glycomyces mayteni]
MWGVLLDWVTFGISVVAVGVSVWSVRVARRSADAAVISAEASARMATLAEIEASRPTPPWKLEPHKPGAVLLINTSGEAAHRIRISGDVFPNPPKVDIGPFDSIRLEDLSGDGGDGELVVVWDRPPEAGGETVVWHGVLP